MTSTSTRLVLLAAIAYTALGCAPAASASSAPSTVAASPPKAEGLFRNGLTHSGGFPSASGIYGGVLWRAQTGAPVRSSPTLAGGVALVGSSDAHLYALEADTGHVRWKFEADGAVASSPAVLGGRVFFSTYKGTFYAVSFNAGQLLWKAHFGADIPRPEEVALGPSSPMFNGDFVLSSAAVVNDIVVVGGGDGFLYALDAASGAVRWKLRTEGRIRSSPAIADGKVYVGSFDGSVYAADLASGYLIWRYDTKGRSLDSKSLGFDRRAVLSSPAIADGLVFIGSRDAHLYAIDATKGTARWIVDYEKDDMTWSLASPAVHDHVVYAGTADGHYVHAVAAADGRELWRFPMPDRVWSSPAISGSTLYVGNQSGALYAVDTGTGVERWHFDTGASIQSSAAVSGGSVYFGSNDGAVYALRADGKQPMQRAVYFDAKMAKIWTAIGGKGEAAFKDFFQGRGYEVLDHTAFGGWVAARIADHGPSVVVFATSFLPPDVEENDADRRRFRAYLEGGGKVLWCGSNPPLLLSLIVDDKRNITGVTHKWDEAGELVGVSYKGGLSDETTNDGLVTPAGRDCGLPEWWLGAWDVPVSSDLTVLGLDDRGYAVAWARSYGGPPGTGFVYVGMADWDRTMLQRLAVVAEYRPRR